MKHKYARIIIDNSASKLDKLFTYILGEELLEITQVGMRVVVPFGHGNKLIKGLIIEIVDEIKENYKFKKIIDVLDDKPIISKNLIELGIWIKEEYISTYLEAFQPILPPGDYKQVNSFIEIISKDYKSNIIEEEKIIQYLKKYGIVLLDNLKKDLNILNINKHIKNLENLNIIETTIDIKTSITKKKQKCAALCEGFSLSEIESIVGERAFKQLEIVRLLYGNGEMTLEDIMMSLDTSLSTIKALEAKNVIYILEKVINREAVKREIAKYKKHKLNLEQNQVFQRIMKNVNSNSVHREFLVHGITGSGKTEVYLQIVEQMLYKDKDTIILVPEISLTPQTIDRFVGRFGSNVAVLHSKLSQGERFDEWRKIKEGKVKIVVGARSAVFAPFKDLGLIIIDEEHESTYKSSQNPKYQTVEVARKRIEMEDAFLILGTATPSLETYNKALKGEVELLELNKRANQLNLPEVVLIDMREELKDGNKSIFSQTLYEEMSNTLNKGKQIILFLNKRGFSSFISCRNCGYVVKCKSCEISMTYYKHIHKLRCHYCGETEEVPHICPECNSKYIKYFGVGTEQIEEMVKEAFPNAKISRMDSDSTTKKGSYENILQSMKKEETDILIGTQMISKGLDFENVSLVGIIAADTTLNLPDYRAPEKSFQLITQVSGRSGRGKEHGKVILQTYNPDHYSIVHAKDQDYIGFFNSEIILRKEFLYPPFINLMNILIYGKNKFNVGKLSKEIYNIIGREIYYIYENDYKNHIIGPNPAPIEKIKDNYRYQIILKLSDESIGNFKKLVKRVCIYNEYNLNIKDIKISIDINPVNIL
ncbi:primosomal protein N' [Tissierella creatinophila]|uniref:Replication restart protein PriA n=1 Tax=Tissierella creatinophila DSM 6911 TaxID=1123403 RepID=A0A1U7M345_TISCR|nr:primosomal protein N' [Tissierella creatinophila]OLS01706.1 primosomal protein N' [Tissierella creatinophila DSM 6911]